jgi:hypothetical protein
MIVNNPPPRIDVDLRMIDGLRSVINDELNRLAKEHKKSSLKTKKEGCRKAYWTWRYILRLINKDITHD